MGEGHVADHWRAELMSALDQLSSLRDDLRGDAAGLDPELIAEADELLGKARRAVDELAVLRPPVDAEALASAARRGFDPVTVATTVGITTIVLPFVQSLVENAGTDVYRALTAFVRRRRTGAKSGTESARPADPERILLGDRDSNVHVLIDAGVDGDAVEALQDVDFSRDSLRDVTLRWDPRTKTWEPEPGRRPVDLWLPGDPLDEDRGKAS